MARLKVLLIICSVFVHTKCVGERENGFEHSKAFDLGLETCLENFDVHADKIIRTQDSRAMGAKYLNEAEVTGREDCMKFCCETPTCDVFVFEQKSPGSCYLFHCGSPEDFKCKFTQHRNYTSAVLALSNRLTELENRIKLSKHEEELNMLRKLDLTVDTTSLPPSSTKVPVVPPAVRKNYTKSQCSRYQFECRGNGECIAIYNVCDGIPQCSDESDEGSELDCPTISGLSHPKTFHDQLKSLKSSTNESPSQKEKLPEIPPSSEPIQQVKQVQVIPPSVPRQQPVSSMGYFPFGYGQGNDQIPNPIHSKIEPQQQQPQTQGVGNQIRYYGREGEMVQYPVGGGPWQGYQGPRQEENSHLFGHKSVLPEASDSQFPLPYSNEMSRADYGKYGGGGSSNGYYGGNGPVYYPGPNGWPQRIPQQYHGLEDVPQRPISSMYGNGISGSVPSDYYYEDAQYRGRYPPVPPDSRRLPLAGISQMSQKNPITKDSDKTETLQDEPKDGEPKKTESVKKTLGNPTSTSTSIKMPETTPTTTSTTTTTTTTTASTAATSPVAKQVHHHQEHSGFAEHLKMSDSELGSNEVDGVNERPSGAILSLTLGMCITAIMITLVGCRLRLVRRRMRRSNTSSYAHDADFLVNGMYL